MTRLLSTPSQTVGPFLSIGMTWPEGDRVVPENTPGAFWIRGRVLDGAGEPVPDGVIETWQVNPYGFGRSLTGREGQYAIYTVKPGRVGDGSGEFQAPHLDVSVFARGLLHRVVMRIYFADEWQTNAEDPVLVALPDDEARSTLIAQPDDAGGFALDICLQGDHETVFFAV